MGVNSVTATRDAEYIIRKEKEEEEKKYFLMGIVVGYLIFVLDAGLTFCVEWERRGACVWLGI